LKGESKGLWQEGTAAKKRREKLGTTLEKGEIGWSGRDSSSNNGITVSMKPNQN